MRDHKQGSHIDGITTQNAIREECYWWEKLVDKSGRKKNHRIYKKKDGRHDIKEGNLNSEDT